MDEYLQYKQIVTKECFGDVLLAVGRVTTDHLAEGVGNLVNKNLENLKEELLNDSHLPHKRDIENVKDELLNGSDLVHKEDLANVITTETLPQSLRENREAVAQVMAPVLGEFATLKGMLRTLMKQNDQ